MKIHINTFGTDSIAKKILLLATRNTSIHISKLLSQLSDQVERMLCYKFHQVQSIEVSQLSKRTNAVG